MLHNDSTDCLVIGGGIVGLSIAYELALAGRSVRLIDRGEVGKEASWAGAGLLPPGSWFSDHPAIHTLAEFSRPLHAELSERLRRETGIDDQLTTSGALYAITPDNAEQLAAKFAAWSERGIASRPVSAREMTTLEPQLAACEAVFVADECQVRNPRRLGALLTACQKLGVAIEAHQPVERFELAGEQIVAAVCPGGRFTAEHVCLAAGAWTGGLAEQLGFVAGGKPIRGQILLLRLPEQPLTRIYHQEGQYLAPRRDGRVLVGSTVEDAGFDKGTVRADLDKLLQFAHTAAPCLQSAEIETSWAGLRPASADGLPLIGPLPGVANGWIASGHFRSGLQFAPATAVIMRQLLAGEPTIVDAEPFAPTRLAAKIAG